MTVSALSLFEPDGDSPLRVRDLVVSGATTRDVEEFCSRYHYTGQDGTASRRYGLWHGFTLLGIVAYNFPTPAVRRSLFGQENAEHVWHMGRLVCAPEAPRNSESRLISGSLRLMVKDHPDTWAVVTYAATDQGHLGYVYQATNAIYTGVTGSRAIGSYVDGEGRMHSTLMHKGGGNIPVSLAAERGWKPIASGPMHRYVYLLGDRRRRRLLQAQLRFRELPYPKENREVTIEQDHKGVKLLIAEAERRGAVKALRGTAADLRSIAKDEVANFLNERADAIENGADL